MGIVNLEGPIVEGAGYAHVDGTKVTLANPWGTGRWLSMNGVLVADVLNNHRADGDLAHTVESLRDNGVVAAGPAPATLDVGGTSVTVWAHDLDDDGVPAAITAELAKGSGVRVESLHVDGPPSYLPTPALEAAVDAAVTGGADIVVAHGTHVVGPVERRGGTVIAWGLGNLVFDCTCTRDTEALVLRVTLSDGHPAAVLPIRAGLDGASPEPAPDATGLLNLVDALGGTRLVRQGDFGAF